MYLPTWGKKILFFQLRPVKIKEIMSANLFVLPGVNSFDMLKNRYFVFSKIFTLEDEKKNFNVTFFFPVA